MVSQYSNHRDNTAQHNESYHSGAGPVFEAYISFAGRLSERGSVEHNASKMQVTFRSLIEYFWRPGSGGNKKRRI